MSDVIKKTKKWYESKTIGIIATQSILSVVGYLNGDLTIKGLIASILLGLVLAINRIHGTSTEIKKA